VLHRPDEYCLSLEPRFGRGGFCEDAIEAAACHRGADVGAVAGLLEQVRLDVECDRRAGVAKDSAYLVVRRSKQSWNGTSSRVAT
jgi:hypothetical protein